MARAMSQVFWKLLAITIIAAEIVVCFLAWYLRTAEPAVIATLGLWSISTTALYGWLEGEKH